MGDNKAQLEIRLLGPFEVLMNGSPVTNFKSLKARALLVYLTAEAHHPHLRDQLTGLLWPDWPQKSAMSNLRYALSDPRKDIDDRYAKPPFLHISRSSLKFNIESSCWMSQ